MLTVFTRWILNQTEGKSTEEMIINTDTVTIQLEQSLVIHTLREGWISAQTLSVCFYNN